MFNKVLKCIVCVMLCIFLFSACVPLHAKLQEKMIAIPAMHAPASDKQVASVSAFTVIASLDGTTVTLADPSAAKLMEFLYPDRAEEVPYCNVPSNAIALEIIDGDAAPYTAFLWKADNCTYRSFFSPDSAEDYRKVTGSYPIIHVLDASVYDAFHQLFEQNNPAK